MVCPWLLHLLTGNVVPCTPPPAYLELSYKVGRVFGALSPPITVLMLPPGLASVYIQASIRSTKILSTCSMPGAEPSTGHQAELSQQPVAPCGTLGLLSLVILSTTMSQNYPSFHSPPMTLFLSSLSGWNYFFVVLIITIKQVILIKVLL